MLGPADPRPDPEASTDESDPFDVIDPVARTRYVRAFEREVASLPWRPVPAREVRAALLDAELLLAGEYHPLPSAARTAADALARFVRAGLPCALGLEMIHARDQRALDDYFARRCGADELRRRIRWREEWGYAWAPSGDLLRAARDARVPAYGLDIPPRGGASDLRPRDRVAAARIAERLRRDPLRRLVVVFGEAHLAARHLPAAIARAARRPVRVVRVFHDLDVPPAARETGWLRGGDGVFARQDLPPAARRRALLATWRRWERDVPAPGEVDAARLVHLLAEAQAESLGLDLRRTRTGRARWLADDLPEVVTPAPEDAYDAGANELRAVDAATSPLSLLTARWLVATCTRARVPTTVPVLASEASTLALALLVDPGLDSSPFEPAVVEEARATARRLRLGAG